MAPNTKIQPAFGVCYTTPVQRTKPATVHIYNRALTAAEVKQLYKLGTVTIHPN